MPRIGVVESLGFFVLAGTLAFTITHNLAGSLVMAWAAAGLVYASSKRKRGLQDLQG